MKFFKRLQQNRTADHNAAKVSEALVDEVVRTDAEVDREHQIALIQLDKATKQAWRLRITDHANHYSESLSVAFREGPAQ